MSSIEFDEPKSTFRTIDISGAVTHNTPYLIRFGIVKDLSSANKTMLVIFVLLLLSAFLVFHFRSSSNGKIYREDYTSTELSHMLPDMVNALPSKPK